MEMKRITAPLSDGVIEQLKAGDKVVAEGIQKVRDGATVNPVPFGSVSKKTPAATENPQKKS